MVNLLLGSDIIFMTKIFDIVTKSKITVSQEDLATLLITKLSLDKQERRNLIHRFSSMNDKYEPLVHGTKVHSARNVAME